MCVNDLYICINMQYYESFIMIMIMIILRLLFNNVQPLHDEQIH